MAFLGNMLATAPSGAWVGIIQTFEGALGNYVLAVILLTVIIRLVWSLVDTVQKYSQQRMSTLQAQMQPELEKLNAKYEKQPQVLKQKQNELYQRHYGKTQYGSCIVMLVAMVLNLVIFFTLFSGLNSMAAFKIKNNYENIKYTYANCISVTDDFFENEVLNPADGTPLTTEQKYGFFAEYDKLSFVFREVEVAGEEVTKTVVDLVYTDGDADPVVLITSDYKGKEAFTTKVTVPPENEGEEATEKDVTNANIIALIQKYIPVYEEGEEEGSKEIIIKTQIVQGENGDEEQHLYLSTAIQNVAMKNVVAVYDDTKESFLWIENIWIADSPLEKSILSYNAVANQIGKKNLEEGEETIYNAFMTDLKTERNTTNGYLILPLLCIVFAMLSTVITTAYNKRKNAKKGLPEVKANAKWTKIIIPCLLGVFALFYNSVFAIYMLTGQVVSTLILPLQLFIVDKIMDKKSKKDEEKKVTVDYSRKF